jgi:hypothetical protein
MAECKPNEKSTNQKVDLTSMSSVLKILLGAFNIGQKPAQSLPPPIDLLAKDIRPGMSPRNLAARQIAAVEAIGIPMGDVFADGPNKDAQVILSNAIEGHAELLNAVVEGYSDVGSIQSAVSATAGPIPVVGTASNILPVKMKGGIH